MNTTTKQKKPTLKLEQMAIKLPNEKKVKPVSKKSPPMVNTPVAETTPVIPAKDKKDKKIKLIRDSFTITTSERAVLKALKQRSVDLKMPMKKSDLIRAGIEVLANMDNASFIAQLQALPPRKL